LVSIIDSANKSKVTMLLNLGEKHSLENVTITNIVTSTTQDKSLFWISKQVLYSTIISGFISFLYKWQWVTFRIRWYDN
jgi:hypothetical protein